MAVSLPAFEAPGYVQGTKWMNYPMDGAKTRSARSYVRRCPCKVQLACRAYLVQSSNR